MTFVNFPCGVKIAPHENFAPRTMPATSATKMMFASKPLLVGHNLFGPGEDATKGYGFTTHMQMIWMWIKHTLFHKKGKPTWPLAAEQNRRQQHPLSSQLLPATWWWKQPDDPEFRFKGQHFGAKIYDTKSWGDSLRSNFYLEFLLQPLPQWHPPPHHQSSKVRWGRPA